MIVIREEICDRCGTCISVCPRDAIVFDGRGVRVLPDRCDRCQRCLIVCPVRAVEDSP